MRERVAQQNGVRGKEKENIGGSGGRDETALIYLSNHKLAGSHNATRRESATIFLSVGPRRDPRTEGVNVTHVCVACSTGNAIYTMQIKRAHAARTRDPARLVVLLLLLLLTFLLLYRIARRSRFTNEEIGNQRTMA